MTITDEKPAQYRRLARDLNAQGLRTLRDNAVPLVMLINTRDGFVQGKHTPLITTPLGVAHRSGWN